MRNKSFPSFFLVCAFLLPSLAFSQITQIPLHYPTGIDGPFIGLTKTGGLLYGQTAAGTYSSEDGQTWYPCGVPLPVIGVSADSVSVGYVYVDSEQDVYWMKGCNQRR